MMMLMMVRDGGGELQEKGWKSSDRRCTSLLFHGHSQLLLAIVSVVPRAIKNCSF